MEELEKGLHIKPNGLRPGVMLEWGVVKRIVDIFTKRQKQLQTQVVADTLEVNVSEDINSRDHFGS